MKNQPNHQSESQRTQRGEAATDRNFSILVTESTEVEPEFTEAEFGGASISRCSVFSLPLCLALCPLWAALRDLCDPRIGSIENEGRP